jgi:hypothetical protein
LCGQWIKSFTPIWEEILCREERCDVLGKEEIEKIEVVDEERDKNAI